VVLTSTVNPLLSLRLNRTSTVANMTPSPALDDEIRRLTCQLATGDETAFREFHGRYFDRLYQFLLVVARGREIEAQEALQLTLLRVLRYGREFVSEDAFWSWLKVLARSAARDAGRKEQRYLALLRRFTIQCQDDGPDSRQDENLRVALEETLKELEPLERRLLEGKYLQGMTVKELAEETALTEKAAESRLLRLRRHLRERLLQKLRAS
jgi:RNA polymerase sigma-70 factor (ECF subfamily)